MLSREGREVVQVHGCSEAVLSHPEVNQHAVSVLTFPPFYIFLTVHEMNMKNAAFH